MKRSYHWIVAHAITDEAEKQGLAWECDFGMVPGFRVVQDTDVYDVDMSEADWLKIEEALPHIFSKRQLDLRGKLQRFGMESQSCGMDAWQDIAPDKWGDYVRLEDVVKFLKDKFGYDQVLTSYDCSDDWEGPRG